MAESTNPEETTEPPIPGDKEEEISSAGDKEEQERLADVIKGVHKHLRSELSTGHCKQRVGERET